MPRAHSKCNTQNAGLLRTFKNFVTKLITLADVFHQKIKNRVKTMKSKSKNYALTSRYILVKYILTDKGI